MDRYLLLTGGTGFIGSHLAEVLLKNNYKLILLKRHSSDLWRINHLLNNNNLVLTDNLVEIFDNYSVEGVFHLATHYIKNHSFNDISKIMQSNVEFPSKLIDLSVNNNVKYFINTGTFFEYSPILPLSEKSEIKSFNLYSASKLAFEDILKYYSSEYCFPVSTLKLFTPYGPKDDEKKIIPYLIINSLKNIQVNINNPYNRLDIVHVYDIVDAYLNLKDKIQKFSDYEVFNVANDVSYTINDIYSVIKFILGLSDDMDLNPQNYVDTSKISNSLNWNPKIGIYKGIKNTIDYYRRVIL